MDEKCCVPFFPFCVQQSMQGSFQLLSPLFDYIQASKEGKKTTGKKAEETLLNFVMRLSHTRKGCWVSFQIRSFLNVHRRFVKWFIEGSSKVQQRFIQCSFKFHLTKILEQVQKDLFYLHFQRSMTKRKCNETSF